MPVSDPKPRKKVPVADVTGPANRGAELPMIDPAHVEIDSEGFCFRQILVRCQKGMIADDLRNPSIWHSVQASRPKALKKLDRLFLLACDESWYAEAIVTYATAAECRLRIRTTGSFREPDASLFSDGTMEVRWDGRGYAVYRSADNARVLVPSFSTEQQAISALLGTYAKVVA